MITKLLAIDSGVLMVSGIIGMVTLPVEAAAEASPQAHGSQGHGKSVLITFA